jgi:hypothetical protein
MRQSPDLNNCIKSKQPLNPFVLSKAFMIRNGYVVVLIFIKPAYYVPFDEGNFFAKEPTHILSPRTLEDTNKNIKGKDKSLKKNSKESDKMIYFYFFKHLQSFISVKITNKIQSNNLIGYSFRSHDLELAYKKLGRSYEFLETNHSKEK